MGGGARLLSPRTLALGKKLGARSKERGEGKGTGGDLLVADAEVRGQGAGLPRHEEVVGSGGRASPKSGALSFGVGCEAGNAFLCGLVPL